MIDIRNLTRDDLPHKQSYERLKIEMIAYRPVDEEDELYQGEEEQEDYGIPLKAEVAREFGYILISHSNYGKNVIENKMKTFEFVRLDSPQVSSKLNHPFYKDYPDYIRTYYHEAGSGFIDAHIWQQKSNKKLVKLRDQFGLPVDVEF